ncbi:MAG: tetratricopeptide repeat protein, partial [Candidatus Omnitrophica bacterium]|nr:tetratricopeptide repeat protein [Candidatus Omnitrophota bacterium]
MNIKYRNITYILALVFLFFSSGSLAHPSEKDDFCLARQAYQDEFYDEARTYFLKFQKNYSESSYYQKASLFIAICSFKSGNLHDAQGELNALLSNSEAEDIKDEALFWLSQIHLQNKDYAGVIESLRSITESYPDSEYLEISYYLLAEAFRESGRYKEAVEIYRKFVKTFKDEELIESSYLEMARCLKELGGYDESNKCIKEFAAGYPKSKKLIESRYLTAENYYHLEEYGKAISSYNEVLASSDESLIPYALYGLGWIYFQLNDNFNSHTHLNKLINEYPDSVLMP